MEYGYARVSSTEQNLDRQILALQKYVKQENIVVDKQSGKNLDRPGYNPIIVKSAYAEGCKKIRDGIEK